MCLSEYAAPACEEKARLLRICAEAESSHQRAIQQLTWIRDTLKTPNYEDLQELVKIAREIVKDARRAAKDARRALERHTAKHGC